MSAPLVPHWTASGFALAWSWPYLACGGPAGTTIHHAYTGAVAASAPAWFAGWLDPGVAMVLNDCPGGQRRSLLAATGEVLALTDPPETVIGSVASSGSWASCVNGVIRLNGAILDQHPGNLGIWLAGDWLAHTRNAGPSTEPEWQRWRTRLYHRGVFQREVRHQAPAFARSLSADGAYAYGDAARAFLNEPDGTETDVSVTTTQAEFCPRIITDSTGQRWQWSPVGGEAQHLIVRRLGSAEGYILALPFGVSSFDALERDGRWWLAWGDNIGRVGVAEVALDGSTVALPTPWPMPAAGLPAVPPAPAHLKGCGYFYRDTAVHAYIAQYGGENPEAPGTHSVIVDDHGMPAETRADGTTPRMIVGLGQLLHPQIAEWWDRVDAVYVAVENDELGLERHATMARYLMRELRLSPKPILSYSGAPVYPHALDDRDILGVQLYAERGVDPVQSIRDQAEAYWPQIQRVPRVGIIGQSYDRGGWFDDAQLVAIQHELYAVACAWPNCEYLLLFSDSRAGGTRDHEDMRPVHRAITAAIQQTHGGPP